MRIAPTDVEVDVSVTAEPVIEYSTNGIARPREGNRQRGYYQGVYPTDSDDAWVALSVRDAGDWSQLVEVMGCPELQSGDHDAFDHAVAAWTRTRVATEIVAALEKRGIPVEHVITKEQMYDLPGLDDGFYEDFHHVVTGPHRYPGWPMRITPGPSRHHRFAPPTLGQHNGEILGSLGLSHDELAALRRDGVIGERVMG